LETKSSPNYSLEALKFPEGEDTSRFRNWYFNVTFEYKGMPYVLFAALKAPGFSGGKEISILGIRGPFNAKKEKALDYAAAGAGIVKDEATNASAVSEWISEVDDPKWHVQKLYMKNDDDLRQELKGDHLDIHMGNTSASLGLEDYKLRLNEEGCTIDLDCKVRGPAIWWGNKPDVGWQHSEKGILTGFESFVEATGSANIFGEKLDIRGRGNFEHVSMSYLEMMGMRAADWIVMNFDEAYAFCYRNLSITEDQHLRHVFTGAIYLIEERKLLNLKEMEVRWSNWVYAPSAYRFIPASYEIKGETEEGVFKAYMSPAAPPAWYVHRRDENRYTDYIDGWYFAYWDALCKVEGTFTYKNGRVINLTNGMGVNEPHTASPLV
jgi:hypothetical protein